MCLTIVAREQGGLGVGASGDLARDRVQAVERAGQTQQDEPSIPRDHIGKFMVTDGTRALPRWRWPRGRGGR